MSSSTAKRVLLYRFDRPPTEAIVNASAYLLPDGIEVMTSHGLVQKAGYGEVKAICFASEPGPQNLFTSHNLFERRPKVPGLWTRFTFRDGDQLDGILSHNLLEWPQTGFLLTPPRASGLRQRVYLPRPAVTGTELRGVVGIGPAGRHRVPMQDEHNQMRMFER